MKIFLCFIAGAVIGLLIFAIGREIWLTLEFESLGQLLSNGMRDLGSLRWIDTTLVTGLAAVTAAYFSIKAARNQSERASADNRLQMAQGERIEEDRRAAKHAGARAVLPLSLAVLSQYAESNTRKLRSVFEQCLDGALPNTADVPAFEAIPSEVIGSIKEMIEFGIPETRTCFVRLLIAVQVQSSNLNALKIDHDAKTRLILTANIEAYIIGQAEVYARSSALYNYGRGAVDTPPIFITRGDLGSSLFLLGIYDDLRDDLINRYALNTSVIWEPISHFRA